jgi:CMP-N-acetylneuraminic acid synthetase
MNVPVLLIGRGGSRGVPGKNTMNMLGRPLMEYPILAAKHSKHIGQIFLSTDSEEIKAIGRKNNADIIDRPSELCSDDALVEDVVVHGYREIVACVGDIEMFVLLFCNSATITPGIIDEGIEKLSRDPSADSAVTVSLYNEYSPARAKRIDEYGFVIPYVDVNQIPGASCDRDTATPAYFFDCSAWILRSRCADLDNGILPFRWTGKKTIPLYQSGGLDIDHDYGIAQTEYWLIKHGFGNGVTPYK